MDAYKISEEDIAAIIRNLEIHDPQNADREYALQILEIMSKIAKRVVAKGPEFTDLFLQALSEKKKEEEDQRNDGGPDSESENG